MIPLFGYGKPTKSSAAVESMWNKIKNTTFKDITIPTNLESFIERRVTSLKGSALLKHGEFHDGFENNVQINSNSKTINTTFGEFTEFQDIAGNKNIHFPEVSDQSLNGYTLRPISPSTCIVEKYFVNEVSEFSNDGDEINEFSYDGDNVSEFSKDGNEVSKFYNDDYSLGGLTVRSMPYSTDMEVEANYDSTS